MAAYTYRMPSGVPGATNRTEHLTVEAGLPLVGFMPPGYGLPLAIDPATGRYRAIAAGDTAASFAGMLVRPYPSGSFGSASDGLGNIVNFGNYAGVINVMKRGYMTVLLGGVTASPKGGTIYIRIALPVAGKPIGGLEAAADGANTIALDNKSYWMGPADAQGNSEIAMNI